MFSVYEPYATLVLAIVSFSGKGPKLKSQGRMKSFRKFPANDRKRKSFVFLDSSEPDLKLSLDFFSLEIPEFLGTDPLKIGRRLIQSGPRSLVPRSWRLNPPPPTQDSPAAAITMSGHTPSLFTCSQRLRSSAPDEVPPMHGRDWPIEAAMGGA